MGQRRLPLFAVALLLLLTVGCSRQSPPAAEMDKGLPRSRDPIVGNWIIEEAGQNDVAVAERAWFSVDGTFKLTFVPDSQGKRMVRSGHWTLDKRTGLYACVRDDTRNGPFHCRVAGNEILFDPTGRYRRSR